MNRIRTVTPVILLCLLAIALPWLIAQISFDEMGAEMGENGWLALWRGFPFHFVTPVEFGDEFRIGSPPYVADCAFWLVVLLSVRRWFLYRRFVGSHANAHPNVRKY